MLSIGEFSRMCMVTRKTLRHYDSIGLLQPRRAANGYRYYDPSQMVDMRLIHRLKSYGFSLPEIAVILSRRGDAAYLSARLLEKRQALTEQLQSTSRLLDQLNRDACAAEKGYDIMANETQIATRVVSPAPFFSIRQRLSMADFAQGVDALLQRLAQAGLTPGGPMITLYHDEDFDPENSDVEMGFVVPAGTPDTRLLDPGLCAYARHTGPYDAAFQELYTRIAEWITGQGYRMSGPVMDFYIRSGNEAGITPADYVTEIYFPIAKG